MKAISIAPATADCILNHGQDILNRTCEFPRHLIKLLKDPIALHTSKGFPEDVRDIFRNHGVKVEPLAPGCVVAVVKVLGCPRRPASTWARAGFIYWQIELVDTIAPLKVEGRDGAVWSLTESDARAIARMRERKALKDRSLAIP